ncbi:MAG: DNA polymerase IV [Candidatus Micrarchaeota archaeon]|nr:DNA polymerase IV [Candidatus Micrarchaeota archaeon]
MDAPNRGKNRIILHVDLDAFFAAVEERRRPELRGKPVVVGADPKAGRGRGVVSTSNYEARKYGIRSGMPIVRAYRLCPNAVFLPVDFAEYVRASEKIMEILEKYADAFEQVSIDEAFLDVTARAKDFSGARRLAEEIQRETIAKEGLSCSIGIGPNKLVAKVASGRKKPTGLTVVEPGEARRFLSAMKPGELWGIGPKTEAALAELGITTVEQLAEADPQALLEAFGVLGPQFRFMARGIDENPVGGEWEAKSVGREHTFEEDVGDAETVAKALAELASDVCRELVETGFWYRTITLKIRFADFETHTHSKSLPRSTGECRFLLETGTELLRPFLSGPGGKKIRLIGLRASGLVQATGQEKLV